MSRAEGKVNNNENTESSGEPDKSEKKITEHESTSVSDRKELIQGIWIFLTHLFMVYAPLFVFLIIAIITLGKGSIEVFGIKSNSSDITQLESFRSALDDYRKECFSAKDPLTKNSFCTEDYLNNELFIKIKSLEDRYSDLGNSYSTIAVMTGFFGVLMTVLVIYFSISGKEAIQLKLDATEKILMRFRNIVKETEDIKKSLGEFNKQYIEFTSQKKELVETAKQDIKDKIDEFKLTSNELIDKAIKESTANLDKEVKSLENKINAQEKLLVAQQAAQDNLQIKLANLPGAKSPSQDQLGMLSIGSDDFLKIQFEEGGIVTNGEYSIEFIDHSKDETILQLKSLSFENSVATIKLSSDEKKKIKDFKKFKAVITEKVKTNKNVKDDLSEFDAFVCNATLSFN
ncbi:hypothetical protein E0Z06_13340 [Rheinheimera sp. D18]|uniref:hypothetical protein n=1 Tax=Rheinheimera sp. D18 TaxID=2545632 RepID=UPI001043EE59|nr:hypothetical protein [Rheinheimera sp. D18]QBL10443.1 hypothetical protein E0Z06_13340 [Rheinheimera sp. D18]